LSQGDATLHEQIQSVWPLDAAAFGWRFIVSIATIAAIPRMRVQKWT
jgi:hypothetical protein